MNAKKWTVLLVALALIAGTGGLINHLKSHQHLGQPGVKTRPLTGSENLEVVLPEKVLDYASEKKDQPQLVLDMLPKDTSFGQRWYTAPDGFWLQLNVVLMGSDRTSIHKPQFCLEGAGWKIDGSETNVTTIHMDKPAPYDLKVLKLLTTKQLTENGRSITARGIFVYWFVADDTLSADEVGYSRMGEMAWKLISTGVLQRWAYISYFAACTPGQEEQTFDRMKAFIQASAPDFQLVPKTPSQVASTH